MVSALYLMAAAASTSIVFAASVATTTLDPALDPANTAWPIIGLPYESSDETDYINRVCSPNLSNYYTSTSDSDNVQDGRVKLLDDSVFPCDNVQGIQYGCMYPVTNTTGNVSQTTSDRLADERKCMCLRGWLQKELECLACHYVHGSNPKLVTYQNNFVSALESSMCSATPAPTAGYLQLYRSLEVESTFVDGGDKGTDLYPSQTAMSYYESYTVPTAAAAAATSTTAAPGGAGQLQAPGAVVVALMGVMAAL